MSWQPIETAPKDGTRFLVCREPGDSDLEIVEWATHRPEGGWYNGDWTYELDSFTHWMPLPDPPSLTAGKREG